MAVAEIVPADIREWRGQAVVDQKGHRIGKLESVYVETASDEPYFATVTVGPAVAVGLNVNSKLVFVPLDGAVLGPGYLKVAFARALVKSAPSIGVDDVLPAEAEPEVFAHYGLEYVTGAGGERRLARR
ncbi:PRC-barrel domain-containing protein [Kitasatospora sp. NPDC057500]|uniref:PRC-barrel domain-containing protein n=1 Tax=Kitasatospora sp. NPDC057500 TaxID=3346151 RepID=UPI003686AE60